MSETKVVRWKVRYDLENSLADNKGCVKYLFLVCLHCRAYCLPAVNLSAFPAQLMKRRKNSFSVRHWDVLLSLGDPQTLWKLSPLCLALTLTILPRKATFLILEFVTKLQSYNLHQTHVVIPLRPHNPPYSVWWGWWWPLGAWTLLMVHTVKRSDQQSS